MPFLPPNQQRQSTEGTTFTFLTESLLTPDFGSEFPTAGAEYRNARFANFFRERLAQRRSGRLQVAQERSVSE